MNHASTESTRNLGARGLAYRRASAEAWERRRRPPSPALDGAGDRGLSRWALGVGWFSVGLGLGQLLAPRQLARLLGISDGPRTRRLIRALGIRELTAGVGLLSRRRPGRWLWARVAGDLVDLGLLGNLLRSRRTRGVRIGGALAAVAGVTVLDAWLGRRTGAATAAASEPRTVRRSITIGRPPAEVFGFWRDFQNLPRFLVHLESVQVQDPRRSRWRVRGPIGSTFEWNAEIVDERDNELIAWRSIGGSEVRNSGVVRFRPAPGGRGTEIHVEATYDPPAGAFGRLVALAAGEEPGQQIEGDLRRLKQVLETGEVIESDASIHRGRHPARPTVAPIVRKGAERS
ncbi:MAG TPA: SRPBCC family protein [Polyangia bacterium]|jgi:uncharacterized membrane protein|nr:SRPBCC family protein [Polyangia bacterium]